MGNIEKLKNPPIVEAILQISFKIPSLKETKEFKPFVDTYKSSYSKSKELISLSIEKIFNGSSFDKMPSPELVHNGYVLSNDLETKNIVLTRDSIALNRRKGYSTWEDINQEFRNIWLNFIKRYPTVEPVALTVRYVNRIDLTVDPEDTISKYFKLRPYIPEKIISAINNKTSLQLEIPSEDGNLISKITQLVKPCTTVFNRIHCNLDIEINKPISNDDDMWNWFEEMRAFKNKIFFSSITEEIITKYNGSNNKQF